jgi:hypothetical protein
MRRVFHYRKTENFMSTRKKNADLPRQSKQQDGREKDQQEPMQQPRLDPQLTGSEGEPVRPNPSMRNLDLTAMLMIGDEHVVINSEEDDNVDFMAEFIDP